MVLGNAKQTAKRGWIAVAILTLVLCLWPVEYRLSRLVMVAGICGTWAGALVLWWARKGARLALIVAGILPIVALCLPGRSPDPDRFAEDYSRTLRLFRGVRYVWGGEGFLGIDCSGLARKGLVWAQLLHGFRTLNGRPIRSAVELWWYDCSARSLRDGYRRWTVQLFHHDSIATVDHARLRPGDLAVTADGVHVLAYLGNRTWIEADPGAGKVIEIVLPTDNPWFKVPVVFVRWTSTGSVPAIGK